MGQFRYILTNLGEKMSDDEVDELLKAVDTSSGELNYMGMAPTNVMRESTSTDCRQTWSRPSLPIEDEMHRVGRRHWAASRTSM